MSVVWCAMNVLVHIQLLGARENVKNL